MRQLVVCIRVLLRCAMLSGLGCSSSNRDSGTTSSPMDGLGGTTSSTTASSSPPEVPRTLVNSGGAITAGGQTGNIGGVMAMGGISTATAGSATGGTAVSSSGSANPASGGRATGGNAAMGGATTFGGTTPLERTVAIGGTRAAVGGSDAGATSEAGSLATGGAPANGGASAGSEATGGSPATGGTSATSCEFTIIAKGTSPYIATVALIEWSTTLSNLRSAQIVYSLDGATSTIINKGGTAPVDLTATNYRTRLLGLKQSSTYTFHIEATASDGTRCTSPDNTISTGSLSSAPDVTRTPANESAQASGFIVTCSGQSSSGTAYIIDSDGSVVWSAPSPNQCTRAHMDYEGQNMWMLALNVSNNVGEMRYVSMDGQNSQNDVTGLSKTHHDFTVLPGGVIAAMSWAGTGIDPESELLERSPDGAVTSKFRIGSNLYVGGQSAMGGSTGSFHCNYIVYHPADDTFTISDRNPSLVVKVSRTGNPVWQIGGTCANAPAANCAAGSWKVDHGHDFDPNGNIVVFNNGQAGAAHILEFAIADSDPFGIAPVKDYTANATSSSLGDVQRLPNGNTLITFSNAGQIVEVDPWWKTVQTLKGNFGYAGWRETLYGPPTRK